MKIFFLIFLVVSINTSVSAKKNHSRFSFGTGIYNFMENGKSRCTKPQSDQTCFTKDLEDIKSSSAAINVEYYTKKKVFKYIHPYFGFLATHKKAYYSYFGLGGDLFFLKCKCFIVSPSLAVGWYVDGDDIKLGNRIQFKSGGDLMYKFKNDVRLGMGVYHLSNANLGNENPGSEQVIIKYQFPLR